MLPLDISYIRIVKTTIGELLSTNPEVVSMLQKQNDLAQWAVTPHEVAYVYTYRNRFVYLSTLTPDNFECMQENMQLEDEEHLLQMPSMLPPPPTQLELTLSAP